MEGDIVTLIDNVDEKIDIYQHANKLNTTTIDVLASLSKRLEIYVKKGKAKS